jgi:uncharacterized membrane protein YphA (DoxX/SURF4 family)
MSIALWIVQFLLAAAFGMAGAMKATQPIPDLIKAMAWVEAVPAPLVRFIGTCEFLGALGLLLPALTRIKPGLTPLAGAGLAAVMLLAMGFHATRGETQAIVINLVLGSLSAFVAWGRWKKAPVLPKAQASGSL